MMAEHPTSYYDWPDNGTREMFDAAMRDVSPALRERVAAEWPNLSPTLVGQVLYGRMVGL